MLSLAGCFGRFDASGSSGRSLWYAALLISMWCLFSIAMACALVPDPEYAARKRFDLLDGPITVLRQTRPRKDTLVCDIMR